MYKNFTLTESEREEILNRHKDHGYRQPLNEQSYSSSKGTKLPARYMPLYDRLSEVNILNVSKNDTSVRWDTDNSKYHVIFMVSLNDPILGISVNDSKSPDSFGYRLEKELMSYWTKKGYKVYDPGGIVQLVNKPIPDVTLDLIKFFRKYPLDLKGFSSEGKPTKPNPKWKVISEYLKNNMINGFKFVGFIEDISSQGAEMKNNKGQELVVDPNGNWTIYSSGSGNSKGTWKWDGSKVIMGSPQPITGVSQSNIGSSKPMNEQGYNSGSGQECYRFGEIFVCVGDKNNYVADLQKQLNQSTCQKGLPPITVDGMFGPETKQRIMVNQKSNCKVPDFDTQQYKRVKTPTGEKYVPVKVSGINLS